MNTKKMRERIISYCVNNHPLLRVAYHPHQKGRWFYTTFQQINQPANNDLLFNHRQVIPCELVLDFDDDDKKVNLDNANKIIKRLEELGFSYAFYDTGNKGYHIHLLFEGLDKVKDSQLMRNKLWDYIKKDHEIKIDTQLFSPNHLVRFEGGLHEKTYGKTHSHKELIKEKSFFKKNPIPKSVFQDYEGVVFKNTLARYRRAKKISKKSQTPLCLAFLMSDEFKNYRDGGKRALFVITSYYRNLPDEDLVALVKQYNRYVLKNPLPERQLLSIINSVRKHKGRHVGCRYRHELLRSIGAGSVADRCEEQKKARGASRD